MTFLAETCFDVYAMFSFFIYHGVNVQKPLGDKLSLGTNFVHGSVFQYCLNDLFRA